MWARGWWRRRSSVWLGLYSASEDAVGIFGLGGELARLPSSARGRPRIGRAQHPQSGRGRRTGPKARRRARCTAQGDGGTGRGDRSRAGPAASGAASGDRLEALYALTLALGLRQSEALGLRWEDVDLEAGALDVRRTLQRAEGEFRFFDTRTPRSQRTAGLADPLVEKLRAHRTRQPEDRLAAGGAWEGERWGDLVLATQLGGPLSNYVVTTHFQKLLAEAGLPRMRFHELRNAAATVMLTLGVQARVVMETLGHSQISTTMDRYSHVIPELQRDASERVGAALWDVG